MDTRREFIKKAAFLAGAAGLSGVLPVSIQKAMAINAAPGSTYMDAEHVVLLMQENRSFDHCFGTLKGVRGYNDPRAIDLPNKNKVWLQSNNKGETYAPFRLDIKQTKSTWMESLPHSWKNQVNARNDGKFDQWLENKRNSIPEYSNMPLTLGYYTREDIPFYYSLADAFTVCDQNFCSALTGTNPNRLFFWTGTVRPEQHENSRAHVWNDDMDYGTLNWPTFPERLEEQGISWKCYQNEVDIDTGFQGEEGDWLGNFQDNPLEFFGQYNIHLHDMHVKAVQAKYDKLNDKLTDLKKQLTALPEGDEKIPALKKKIKKAQSDVENAAKDKEKAQPGMFEKLSDKDKNLHNKAFDTNKNDPHYRDLTELKYNDDGTERQLKVPKGDILHQFRDDVNTGKLPMVSWISAPTNFSDHPSAAWFGAWYVSEVMDILTKNPEVWKKTIFILAYDENDGYFDHVPPFTAPHSDRPNTGRVSKGIDTRVDFITHDQEKERNGFPEPFDRESSIGLGYRVPLIIASPWSKGGWVNSEVFDHTSTLQFLEKFLSAKTGKTVKEHNISDWRRTVCGDLTSVFRPYNGETIPNPEFLPKDEFVESIHKAKFKKLPDDFKVLTKEEIEVINKTPKLSPYMPKQEEGTKPSCPIPYQIYADGKLTADKKAFEIKFTAGNSVFGESTAGVPFNVYTPGLYFNSVPESVIENVHTWAYGVSAGDTVTDHWQLDQFENNNEYHLRVYGPNGFYREFKGNKNDPEILLNCGYQQGISSDEKLSGNVELVIESPVKKDHEIEITDHTNPSKSSKQLIKGLTKSVSVIMDSSSNHNWYDFSVKIKGIDTFEKRYAGHVETGKPSFSDPQMGNA